MKRKYDLVFGIGGTCRCSMGLREAGLQYLSFPMDWHPGPGFVGKCEAIASSFPDWLDRDALVLQNPEEKDGHLFYKNEKTGFTFLHDFHTKFRFEQQYPEILRKYERRIARMLGLIERSKSVLVTWVNVPDDETVTMDIARAGQAVLSRRWPDKRFDVLVFNFTDGLHYGQSKSEERNGIRFVTFDYKDRSPGEDRWMADHRFLGKWLESEYAVDDYRTPEEIAAWKRKKSNYEYDRWCAGNAFAWLRNKIEYKIYVHLRKQLKKRGII